MQSNGFNAVKTLNDMVGIFVLSSFTFICKISTHYSKWHSKNARVTPFPVHRRPGLVTHGHFEGRGADDGTKRIPPSTAPRRGHESGETKKEVAVFGLHGNALLVFREEQSYMKVVSARVQLFERHFTRGFRVGKGWPRFHGSGVEPN